MKPTWLELQSKTKILKKQADGKNLQQNYVSQGAP